MHKLQAGEHVHCLDLLRVVSLPGTARSFCDCAILLEIWDFGGLLQTNVGIPAETDIYIPSVGHGMNAKVVSCQQDEFGFLVEISVDGPGWFPEGYVPPHLLSEPMA